MPNRSQLLNPDYYVPFVFNGARIVFVLVFAYLATRIVRRLIRGLEKYSLKMMIKAGGDSEYELEKRAKTVGGVALKSSTVIIWVVAGLMILKEMNFDVRPLLAGAGVVGVAFGFGAQNLVKDVISGLLLLIENQMRINDVVTINGKSGLVEEINLRTTVLRGEDGAVHIFPNGTIQGLSNMTREYSYYVMSISVGYREDTDHVSSVLKQIGEELAGDEAYRAAILAPLELMGVDKLGDSAVVIKARIKTQPLQQWTVGREMNRRIKKRFEQAEIEIPFPSQTIQLAPSLPDQLRSELKGIVREVLAERSA
jgi:small conductance mechanosensitive channel